MINYTCLLREALKSPSSQWNVYQHPSFTAACRGIEDSRSANSKGQSNKEKKLVEGGNTMPARRKSDIDLVSCYKSVLQLSKKSSKRKHSVQLEKEYYSSKPARLSTIEQRLVSEQDRDADSAVKRLAATDTSWLKDNNSRESTAVSLKQKQMVLNVRSIGVRPFTQSLSKIRVAQPCKKIPLDVGQMLVNTTKAQLGKQKERVSKQRYFSR